MERTIFTSPTRYPYHIYGCLRSGVGSSGRPGGSPGVRSLSSSRSRHAPYQRERDDRGREGHIDAGHTQHGVAFVHRQHDPALVHPPLGGQEPKAQRTSSPSMGPLSGKGYPHNPAFRTIPRKPRGSTISPPRMCGARVLPPSGGHGSSVQVGCIPERVSRVGLDGVGGERAASPMGERRPRLVPTGSPRDQPRLAKPAASPDSTRASADAKGKS